MYYVQLAAEPHTEGTSSGVVQGHPGLPGQQQQFVVPAILAKSWAQPEKQLLVCCIPVVHVQDKPDSGTWKQTWAVVLLGPNKQLANPVDPDNPKQALPVKPPPHVLLHTQLSEHQMFGYMAH